MNNKNTGTGLANLGAWITLVTLALSSAVAQSAPGLVIEREGSHYSGVTYRETVRDLRVKVLGGFVTVRREWRDGRWYFNPNWADLQFRYDSNATDGEPSAVERYDLTYERTNGAGTPTYAYLYRVTVSKTDTGYRWQNREGDWIDYDANGKTLAYGNRNNVQVSFRRNLEGWIEGVRDHFGNEVVTFAYDAVGNVQRVLDYSGREVIYTWVDNDLTNVTDVRGFSWTYDYDTLGESKVLASRTDPGGYVKQFNHEISAGGQQCIEGDGLRWVYNEEVDIWEALVQNCTRYASVASTVMLSSIADGVGPIKRFAYFYDAQKKHYVMTQRDGEGVLTERRVDLDGEVLYRATNGRTELDVIKDGRHRIRIDANGHRTRTDYDQWNNPKLITYADGSTVQMDYEPRHSNIIRRVNENGVVTRYEYFDNGDIRRRTEALGRAEERVTEYTYDASGQLETMTQLGDANTETAITRYTYDTYGNVKTVTDREDHIVEYVRYDVLGNALETKDQRQKVWLREYDNAGNLIKTTTPLGHAVVYVYDDAGRLESMTDARLNATAYDYDDRNRLKYITYPDTGRITYHYDGNDQPIRVVDQENKSQEMDYDAEGLLDTTTDGNGNVIIHDNGIDAASVYKGLLNGTEFPTYREVHDYDKRNRRTRTVQTLINDNNKELIKRFAYDRVGNLKTIWDEESRTTVHRYDGLNRQISATDTASQTTDYAYDDRDNLLNVTNAKDVMIRRYEYDRNNRRTIERFPDEAFLQTDYDSAGNVKRRVDAKGQVARYTYDDASRLAQIDYYPDSATETAGATQKTVTFTYDPNNNLTGYDDGTTSAIYTYDAQNRQDTVTVDFGPFSKGYSYTYHKNGLKHTFTDPEGVTYTYTYDANNQFQSVAIPNEGSITYNRYHWFAPELVTLPGGTTQSYTYDSLMRHKRIHSQTPAGVTLMDYQYTYEDVGNIAAKQTEHGDYVYGYDDADRLTSADNPNLPDEAYTYDDVGNRLTDERTGSELWQYNDSDQLLSQGGFGYDYDANGSHIEKTEGGSSISYGYNLENRLSEVKDHNDLLIANYTYDPHGLRVSKTVGGQTTYFLYAEEGLVAEYDQSGGHVRKYGYRPQSQYGTRPLWLAENGYAFYHRDHLGTPQRLTNNGAAIAWSAEYRAFGDAQLAIASSHTNALRFPGQIYDDETRLHYNYFRDYDPSTGRYVQADPIGLDGGLNTFAYAELNSLTYVDPEGQAAWIVKLCGKGYKLVRRLTNREAVQKAREGSAQIYVDGGRSEAKSLAKNASKGGKPAVDSNGHPPYNNPHTHPGPRPNRGGHIFYKVAAGMTVAHYFSDCDDCTSRKIAEAADWLNPLAIPQDLIDIFQGD